MSDTAVLPTSSPAVFPSADRVVRVDGLDSASAANPLRAGLAQDRNPAACAMVIFGVSGDLTSRKLMPSLYDLAVRIPLPPGFSIVGISRRDWSDDDFRTEMYNAVKEHAQEPGHRRDLEIVRAGSLLRARRLRRSQDVQASEDAPRHRR